MSTLSTLVVKLVGDIGGFAQGMKQAEGVAAKSGSAIAEKLNAGLAAVGKVAVGAAAAGIGAATAAIIGGVTATANWANKLDDLGDVLGTTADESAAILVALKPFGSAGEDITSQMGRLVMGLTDAKGNLGESGKMMEKLGIQFRDAATGKILPATKIMENIANVVGNMPDGLEKTGIMMDLFGRSGKGMSDALGAMANGGLEEARKKAEAFGLTIGDDGVASAINLTKGMADLQLAGQGLAVTIGGPLLAAIVPIVEKLAMWAVEVMPKLRDGISQATAPLSAFVTMIGALVSGLGGGGDPFGVIVNSVYNFLTAIGMARGEAASWAVGIGAFVQDAITLFQQVVTWAQANFPLVRDAIVGAFNTLVGILTPIFNAILSVAQTIFGAIAAFLQEHGEEIAGFVQGAWARIQGIIGGVVGIINMTVVPAFQAIAKFIGDNQDTIKAVIEVAWNFIKMTISNVLTIIEGVIKVATKLIQGDWEGAWKAMQDIAKTVWGNIVAFFEGIPTKLVEIGKSIIEGIVKGLKDAAESVSKALLDILKGAVDAVKAFFGIQSPSKLMAEMGFNIAAGMAQGIVGGSGLVTSAMGALTGAVVPGAVASGGAVQQGRNGAGESGSNGVARQAVVNVYLDGRLVESFVTDMLYTSLQGAA